MSIPPESAALIIHPDMSTEIHLPKMKPDEAAPMNAVWLVGLAKLVRDESAMEKLVREAFGELVV